MTIIKVCLGTSCYVHGNEDTLSFLEDYIKKNNKDATVELSACRCSELCQEGPNIFINDKKYTRPTKDELIQILETL